MFPISPVVQGVVFYVAAFLLFCIVAWGLAQGTLMLLKKKQNYPYEVEIEAALKPFAIKAILFAYKQSELRIDGIGERLHGIDKKKIAMVIYNMIPDELPITVPIPNDGVVIVKIPLRMLKTWFTEEAFAALIEDVFAELQDFLEDKYVDFRGDLEDALSEIEAAG